MSLEDAFAPAESEYKAEVYRETWGHLAPERHKVYQGYIVFALGCFGSAYLNPTVLECELELDASPWFFDALMDFLRSLGGEAGEVYRWDGTFTDYEFKGRLRRLAVQAEKQLDGQSGER